MIKQRPRKCCVKHCQNRFTPRSITHRVCSPECAAIVGKATSAANDRKELAKKKTESRMSDKSYQIKLLEKACNEYVRLRDIDKPCISCGSEDSRYQYAPGIFKTVWQAGHFKAVGSHPELRFNLDNIHRQCISCNMHKGGNQAEYEIGLRKRIGDERVDVLLRQHPPLHLTIDEIHDLKVFFRLKLKELKSNM
jgi:hypothetical protein